ncbi:androgen-induced gene 1 protein-like [Rhopilema esculentum]|uniref:androgen-induced gene 1 protein-like n=1 Tax=Rhopilema esculentum TaxID=499914 RepID=UPI0031D144DB
MASTQRFIHICCFAIFTATLYHNVANIFINGVTNSYGGRFKFLTFINLVISVLYYGLAFVSELWSVLFHNPEVGNNRTVLKKWRDTIFGSLIFPLSAIVTIAFWGVMVVNSELMLPSRLRHMIPVHGLYNHCAHTAPFILSFIQIFLVRHKDFPSRIKASFGFTLFCIGYVIWILWIAYRADIWVYPVLKVLGWSGRILFLGTAYMLGLTFLFVGHAINTQQHKKSSKKLH